MDASSRFIGARVKRNEDVPLITGGGAYVDDLHLPGMVYLTFVRSPLAHARVMGIDVARAAALPGVVAVLTGQETRAMSAPLPTSMTIPGLRVPEHHLLALDRVRFVGEPVAVVVSVDPYVGRDAAELVQVDYDPLPAVVDPERALEADAPVLHPEFGDNVAYRLPLGSLGGDIEAALKEAHVIVRQRMENQRLVPNSMEPRGVVARYDPAEGRLAVWLSTQAPHLMRSQLAPLLGLPEHRIRVIAPHVGGAFGAKLNPYPEEVLAAALALRLGRPVKWTETRSEHMVATSHGRGQVAYLEVGARRDGTITGIRARIIADLGAYLHILTAVGPLQTAMMMTGCYRIPVVHLEVVGVFTNKTPVDPYRGFGRAEAAFYLERLMDILARELDMDPVELRRRNFIPRDAFPHATPTGHVLDSASSEESLARALELLDYQRLRARQAEWRRQGRYVGVGIATYLWRAGFPSVAVPPGLDFIKGGWETATVRVDPSGTVTVLTGVSPHGQGLETTLAQIAGDVLGVSPAEVRVLHSDTDLVNYGMGTMGSRSLTVGGSAVLLAAQALRDKMAQIAAKVLEAGPSDLVFEEGRVCVRGFVERGISFKELAALAYRGLDLPPGVGPGLEATAYFDPPNFSSPNGTHACVVEVDAETGRVRILRYIAVDDCGRVINPMVVEGQLHGGIAQGIGQALMESAQYGDDGQVLSSSFMGYPLPKAGDVPAIEVQLLEGQTAINPLGARGVGEGGTVAAPPAVVNAVMDALAPLGIRHIDMPLLPERVLRALRTAQQR
ncbi:MAG TPA: xanthine dehydrogenase family protein molybdopterin-binding subunit [Dehalococcoidia bacterium]|nr:xanthine dehydrogenase family protein molybdopterin-binding subunit [Dehalococcoidia bacterium]